MCIFCEIIKGNIPCYKVYEDDIAIAFLDISQATYGHTLVLPKKHVANIFELDSKTAEHLFSVVATLSKKICKATGTNNVNILNNNGKIAGQSIDHFHIHILPRYENDNLSIVVQENKLSNDEFATLLEKIKKA